MNVTRRAALANLEAVKGGQSSDRAKVAVQSLWVGSTLSTMEQLCLLSFVANGHPVELYSYEDISSDLPDGVQLLDAASIVPAQRITKYVDRDTYSGFANLFRYLLLFERGGWWVDLDLVCLRPFDFAQDYVFGKEYPGPLANCVLKVPPGSEVMRRCAEVADAIPNGTLRWGQTGPSLFSKVVVSCGLQSFAQPTWAFCPVPYPSYRSLVGAQGAQRFAAELEKAYAVHLWNGMWKLNDLDKEARYPASSIYEQLKARYL